MQAPPDGRTQALPCLSMSHLSVNDGVVFSMENGIGGMLQLLARSITTGVS